MAGLGCLNGSTMIANEGTEDECVEDECVEDEGPRDEESDVDKGHWLVLGSLISFFIGICFVYIAVYVMYIFLRNATIVNNYSHFLHFLKREKFLEKQGEKLRNFYLG